MNPKLNEALRTLARVGVRAIARAGTEIVASVTDDAEDLVAVATKAADEVIEDVRARVRTVRSRIPTERDMKKTPPKHRRK